ncbi:MAG: hypothetical protein LUI39_02750 [Lachnospiraceae bacterium]|nr:hypothetical protein [Lachnospiraceae bacterium]
MKRKSFLILMGLTAALMLSACGNGSSETTETEAPAETETEAATEEGELAAITPSDYLVENASEYITVGNLDGLEVTQYTYTITDEDVQEEIDSELDMYIEETVVDRAAEYGDTVYLTLISSVEGSDDADSEETYFYLGDADYGEEFDEALIGASAADVIKFSITFDAADAEEMLIDDTWVGQTVDFEAYIDSICEVSTPEYDDDFVAENTDYSTMEEYEEAVREELVAEYEEYTYADVLEELITAALAECEVSEIPDDLYDACYEENIESYVFFLDTDEEDEELEAQEITQEEYEEKILEKLYEDFEMTQEEFEEEVEDMAERRLLVSYICEENDIEVTEEDYVAYVEEYAEYYGYDSAADFEADMVRSYLVWSLYESQATELLYSTANITTASYDEMVLTDEEAEDLDDEAFDEEDLEEMDAEDESAEEESIEEDTEAADEDETE